VSEKRFQEMVSETLVLKALLIYDREEGIMFHKNAGENSLALWGGNAPVIINIHPFHAAGRGMALKNEAGKPFLFQFTYPFFGPLNHAVRQVPVGVYGDQPGSFRVPGQAHGLTRHAQTALHFRAYRDIIHIPSEGIG
jgi:hypothetical protein